MGFAGVKLGIITLEDAGKRFQPL